MTNKWLQVAKENEEYTINLRRELHKYPELSFKEYETTKFIKNELHKLGIETQEITETGIVGLIKGREGGKVLGIRADIDALPITEDTGLPFASQNKGVMHACGHDTHAAMLLGAAKILNENKDSFKGTIKLVFQPAEEVAGGARAMIDAGVLENPRVDMMIGQHVFPDFPLGQVVVQGGAFMASADTWELEVIGVQAHGSAPWQGVDANVCAVAIVQALQTIVSRNNDVRSPMVVNVGTINAGQRFNVVSGSAKITGMNRTFDQVARKDLPIKIERIIKGICEAYGCIYTFNYNFLCSTVENDEALSEKLKVSIGKVVGEQNVIKTEKIMGSEDFSEYSMKIPSTFFLLGTGNKEKGTCHPLHSNFYNSDEDSLAIGVASFVQSAFDLLAE